MSKRKPKTQPPTRYAVLVGISHREHGRHEPGEVVELSSDWNIAWLIENGSIIAAPPGEPERVEEADND